MRVLTIRVAKNGGFVVQECCENELYTYNTLEDLFNGLYRQLAVAPNRLRNKVKIVPRLEEEV